MNINISSVSTYAPILTASSKSKEETVTADAKGGDSTKLTVDLSGATAEAGASESSAPTSVKEQIVKQLQEQIERVQQQLQQQQQQLAAAQNSKGSEQEKAQRVMAIQQQISGTMAKLTALQGALMQAMSGSVDTTA